MEPITLRIQSQLADDLAQEATEAGFSSRSEYIRHLLHHRDALTQSPPLGIGQMISDIDTQELSIESVDELLMLISEMDDRIDELEHEVDDLRRITDEAKELSNCNNTSDKTGSKSPSGEGNPSDESDSEAASENEFAVLKQWLQENGPQSEDAREVMLSAAQILDSERSLKTGELKDRLSDRYPDAASYSSIETLWASTVERLYEDTLGFEKPDYGMYSFDIAMVKHQVD